MLGFAQASLPKSLGKSSSDILPSPSKFAEALSQSRSWATDTAENPGLKSQQEYPPVHKPARHIKPFTLIIFTQRDMFGEQLELRVSWATWFVMLIVPGLSVRSKERKFIGNDVGAVIRS